MSISPASSIHRLSLLLGKRLAAARKLARLLLCEVVDPCVLSDRADTFLLGARLKPAADEGDRPNARFFLGVSDANCNTVETLCGGLGSGVPGLEGSRFTLINPYRSTSPPRTSSQSSIPPASSYGRLGSLFVENALPGLSVHDKFGLR